MTKESNVTGPGWTPGPWVVGGSNSRMVLRDIPGMCDGHDGYSVAVTTAHSLLTGSEALANARLIAAAPELFEALELLVAYGEWTIGPESPSHHPTLPSALAQARSALSRATATGEVK